MLISMLVVLAGLMVSPSIASPIASNQPADFLNLRNEETWYWRREVAGSCSVTTTGITLCLYPKAQVDAYQAAHPGQGGKLDPGCISTATHFVCHEASTPNNSSG